MAKAKTTKKKPTRKREGNLYVVSRTQAGLSDPQPDCCTVFAAFSDAKSFGREYWPNSSFWIGTVDESLAHLLLDIDYTQCILDHADTVAAMHKGFKIPDQIQNLVKLTDDERTTLNSCVHLALSEKWHQIPRCYTFLNRQKIEPLKKKRASTKKRKTA